MNHHTGAPITTIHDSCQG